MRRHPPTLVNPSDVVHAALDRQMGALPARSIEQRLDALERLSARHDTEIGRGIAQPSSTGSPFDALSYLIPGVLAMKAVKGTTTPTSITSATGTTIANGSLGPLPAGVPYLVIATSLSALNADAAGFIFGQVRIEALGTTVDGMQTGTASGERSMMASDSKLVVGTGATINIASRARNSAGGLTGSANDSIVWAVAIPLNVAVILGGV